MHRPPPPPRVDDAVPYDYAVVSKQGAPMWWRVPDAEEVTLAQLRYDNTIGKVKAAEKAKKAAEKAKKNPKKVADAEQPEDVLPGVDDEAEPALTPEEIAAREEAERQRMAELKIKWEKLPLHPQRPFMDRGNMISIGSRVKDKGRTWWRTARGGYVQASHTYRYKPKDFVGAEIPDDSDFPFGFVWEDDHAASHRMLEDGKLKWNGKMEWRTFVDVVEEVEINGKAYLKTADDLYVRAKFVRLAEKQPRPEEVKPWERWIDVDLERQLLVAYEGDRPRYATLVSTGRKGTEEESFRTPKGKFRVPQQARLVIDGGGRRRPTATTRSRMSRGRCSSRGTTRCTAPSGTRGSGGSAATAA